MKIYKLIFVGLLTLALLAHGALVWNEKDKIASGYGDFIIFYTGAQIVNAGLGKRLYDLSIQAQLQEPFRVEIRKGPLPYNHLPYELLLFLPVAKLPYLYAYGVWTLANIMLLVGIFKLLLPFVDPAHKLLLGMLLFAFYPTAVALLQGQDSILSTLLMVLAFVNLKSRRDLPAGVLMGMGLYKPQLVLPIAAVLFLKRRWGAVFGFAITAMVLAVVSLGMVGWAGVTDYLKLLSWMDRTQYANLWTNMANVRGLAELIGLNPASHTRSFILLLIYIVLYAWSVLLWKGAWEPQETNFDLVFSHIIVVSLLLSYHMYAHDMLLLIIPLVVMSNYVLLDRAQASLVRPAFLVLLAVFYSSIAAIWLFSTGRFAWAAIALIAFALVIATEIMERRNRADTFHTAGVRQPCGT